METEAIRVIKKEIEEREEDIRVRERCVEDLPYRKKQLKELQEALEKLEK